MQDAFLKAYEKLDQFQGNSKFYTWLVRIAVNESLMRLRKRRTGRMVSIDEDIETEEGSVPRDLADWAPDPEQNYPGRTGRDSAQDHPGAAAGISYRVCPARCGRTFDRGDGGDARAEHSPAVKSRLLRARLQLRERLSRYFRKKKRNGSEK
jgi:RNA polymerase sigma-70 factor (ECF subfamily)